MSAYAPGMGGQSFRNRIETNTFFKVMGYVVNIPYLYYIYCDNVIGSHLAIKFLMNELMFLCYLSDTHTYNFG